MSQQIDIWIGSHYSQASTKILLLGESVYGSGEPLRDYIPRWINGQHDKTFSNLFQGMHDKKVSSTTLEERKYMWDHIVFYNFVTRLVGKTAKDRPTKEDYQASREPLRSILQSHSPHGVLILGKEQSYYSKPIIDMLGICNVVTYHPAWRFWKPSHLSDAMKQLLQQISSSNGQQAKAL